MKLNSTPGGIGYTRDEAPGAIPNGTVVVKCSMDKNDTHAIGSRATIIGSVKLPDDPRFFYFVYWDDMPGVPVGVIGTKITPAGHN